MGPQSGLSKVRHLQKGGCRHRASLIHQDDQGESSLFGTSWRRKSLGEEALGAFRGPTERLTHTQNSLSLSTRPSNRSKRKIRSNTISPRGVTGSLIQKNHDFNLFDPHVGESMHLATDEDLAPIVSRFTEGEPPLNGYRIEMLRYPVAGRSLRKYVALSECPETVVGLAPDERFLSRYYWYARFVREWQATEGEDAGLEQLVFKLLETGLEQGEESLLDLLPKVEAAVDWDSWIP